MALASANIVMAATDAVRLLNHLKGMQTLSPSKPKYLFAVRFNLEMKDPKRLYTSLWVLENKTSHVIANHVTAVQACYKIQLVAHHCRP